MLRYTIEMKPGGYTREEIGDAGTCDALVLVSIERKGRKPHTGAASYEIHSVDSVGYEGGEWAEIPATEMFSIMNFIAHKIMDDGGVSEWQRSLCLQLLEATREKIVGSETDKPKFCDNFQLGFAVIEGHVVINFQQPIEAVGYEPQDARRLGRMLIRLADEAEASVSEAH